jgi:hypothetical protein
VVDEDRERAGGNGSSAHGHRQPESSKSGRNMSRIFTDPDLMTWEAFSSGGPHGLPEQPKIVFNCLSDPHRRARFTTRDGHSSEAEEVVLRASEQELREMLAVSQEL